MIVDISLETTRLARNVHERAYLGKGDVTNHANHE